MRTQLLHYLDKAMAAALVISTTGMVLVVLLQIASRFALPWSPDWTEEMARFCFIYMVSLGAGMALKDNDYVHVSILLDKFPPKARLYLESLVLLLISVLMLVMLVYCFPLLQIVRLQTSAALQLNMAFVYFSVLLMSFFVLLYALLQFTDKLRQL